MTTHNNIAIQLHTKRGRTQRPCLHIQCKHKPRHGRGSSKRSWKKLPPQTHSLPPAPLCSHHPPCSLSLCLRKCSSEHTLSAPYHGAHAKSKCPQAKLLRPAGSCASTWGVLAIQPVHPSAVQGCLHTAAASSKNAWKHAHAHAESTLLSSAPSGHSAVSPIMLLPSMSA